MSGEVWTYPPILSDANKSSRSSSTNTSSSSSQNNNNNNNHGPVPLLPQYPPHNNINVLHQNPNNGNNNNNVNAGVYERSINNDPNVQFAGEENKKYKVSVSFDR